ncbi:MAG: hypothetical protein Q7J36_17050 [Thiobacillus sp.]|nr:hypothetical protein [Thiobacillus sp.]
MRKFTERIVVLVPADEKTRITQAARDAGISAGAFMRRATTAYCAPQDEAMIDEMLHRLDDASQRACATVDSALSWIEASNRRIATMERAATTR